MRILQNSLETNSKIPLKHKGPDPGINLGLKEIKAFLFKLGNPQNKIQHVVHIAGTNGKGSTLAFLEALLRNNSLNLKSGRKKLLIGKYTSPHLISVRERFLINGHKITENAFNDLWKELSTVEGFEQLSYFEKLTALAFKYFTDEQVDVLLLETGLGGRLDATNCVKLPTLCLISSVGKDHEEYLGNTLELIAKEKAGILKAQIPYLSSLKGALKQVVSEEAQRKGAIELSLAKYRLDSLRLGLKGKHQVENAELALNAYKYLKPLLFQDSLNNQITEEDISLLYKPINWPGRFQSVSVNQKKFILDGAHNVDAAISLRSVLDMNYKNKSVNWILGFQNTKDWKEVLKILLRDGDTVIATLITTSEQSVNPQNIKSYVLNGLTGLKLKQVLIANNISESQSVVSKLESSMDDGIGISVVTGSLYLVGEFLELNKIQI